MENKSDLGIEENIDGVTIDELLENKTALKMLLHNHQKIQNENIMLKQDLQRQSTIERELDRKTDFSKISGIFALCSSVALSFGINFVTNNASDVKGWILSALGVTFQIISIYYSFRKVERNV